ncbi:uncharacterized protein LOC130718847 [Lotus japonicus]|uniref:uncharacterized protein LOC130718847 n=1 Tax=Lotus japonicus TaxID=34305 RepID=UPI0025862C1C|nr:uncharacterized protein LOC130718847 [Lotus japonicus]
MEGQSDPENPVLQGSYDTGGTSNDVSYSAEDHLFPTPKFNLSASGRSCSQWTSLPKVSKPSHNYVEYLSESSTYLPNATPEYMIGSSYLPLGGVNGTERNLFCSDPGNACGFKCIDSSSSSNDFDIRKRMGFWKPDGGDEAIAVETESSQNLLYAESRAPWMMVDSIGNKHNASQFDPMGMLGAPTFLPKNPKPGCSSSKQKPDQSRFTDRHRRQRIAENLKALHELLPNPAEGSQAQAYILDDIIDYVKYLQHQIKELSGSRLQADTNAIPLFFHEGYGHYMNQQMLNEPLEEIMGKLLEEHPAAASQLLESKGLFLVPMALVSDLNEAMQVFGGNALV